jgi:hypothetical protein
MGTFLGNRWDIDYINKRIFRDTAETPTVTDTSLALYSALQDLFDEPDQMDDPVPMSAQTPTEFSIINGWFLDDESTQYLTGGAIQSVGWGTTANRIRAISYDATTGFSASDIGETITGGTTGDTGTILAFDDRYAAGDQGVVWIRPDDGTPTTGDDFDNGTEGYTVSNSSAAGVFTNVYAAASGGGTASESGDSLWANVFTLGTLVPNTTLYIYQDGAELIGREVGATNRWWGKGQIDILVKVRSTGNLIDDAELTVFARQYTKLYDNFTIDLSTGGRQPVPLAIGGDLNNTTGYWSMTTSSSSGNWNVGDRIVDDSDDTIEGIITAVSGANPTIVLEYYLTGPALANFSGATGTFANQDDTGAATAAAPTATGPANLTVDPTVSFTAADQSLGGGQASFPYSISIDANANTVADLYEFLKYETARGRTGGGTFVFDAESINGEAYTGNALQVEYNTQTGAFVEGEEVYLHDSGDALVAKGTIVADHDDGTTGDLILRNVRFYSTNTPTQVGDNVAQGSYTDFAAVGSTRTITTPKSAPFGTFAGGTFFGAPGVFLFDVNASDVQAFQLVDDDGSVQNPPVFINVQITGLNGVDNDRVAVFVLTTAGGVIDKAQHGVAVPTGAFNGQGDTQIRLDATIPNDTPESGTIRIVDNINDVELRFRYASFSGTDLTLAAVAEGTGVTTANAAGTTLIDTSANFTNSTDDPEIGDVIYNITDGSWGVIISIDDANTITHTPLQGGAENDWDASDTYAINAVPYDLDGGDEAYVPLIDDIATISDPETVASANFVYLANIPVLIRVRNGGSSDPIIPFEVENTVTNTGLVQAAIRTSDTIAT